MKTLLLIMLLLTNVATAGTVMVCHPDGTCDLVIIIE